VSGIVICATLMLVSFLAGWCISAFVTVEATVRIMCESVKACAARGEIRQDQAMELLRFLKSAIHRMPV
jgi:hypothetical protein